MIELTTVNVPWNKEMWRPKCRRCKEVLKNGEKVVHIIAGQTNGSKWYHKKCYLDGKGRPIYK